MTLPPADWTSEDGRVVLYNRDCLELLPMLPQGCVDAVVTDPPYGINFAAMPTKWQRIAGHKPSQWDSHAPNVSGLLTMAKTIAIWGGNYFDLPLSRGWLAWIKPDAPPSMGSVELCWTNQDQNARHIVQSISATNAERVGHPTQKPIRVMLWTLEQAAPAAETVLDPYMGSASTGVACVKLGRRFIGCEIDEGYFKVAVKRIAAAIEHQAGGPLFKDADKGLYDE